MAVADIITTPCKIYYSNPGTTLPADTVAAGGAWPAGWTALGYTTVPLSVERTAEKVIADIQESLVEIKRGNKKETFVLETTLAELDLDQLALSWGGTASTTAAGAGQPAKEELVGGDDPATLEYQWGFEGSYESAAGNTHPIRLFVWLGVCDFGAKLEFGKSDPTGTALRIEANPDMSKARGQRLFKLQKITAPASS